MHHLWLNPNTLGLHVILERKACQPFLYLCMLKTGGHTGGSTYVLIHILYIVYCKVITLGNLQGRSRYTYVN